VGALPTTDQVNNGHAMFLPHRPIVGVLGDMTDQSHHPSSLMQAASRCPQCMGSKSLSPVHDTCGLLHRLFAVKWATKDKV
jgi:hypothetical protein